MSDQAHFWNAVAGEYETEFIDPFRPDMANPFLDALRALPTGGCVADLGCGPGLLLPLLCSRFGTVWAVDFAENMIQRSRQLCNDAQLTNVRYLQSSLRDLTSLAGQVDVALAVNSLILPNLSDLEKSLRSIRACLRPGGQFLGIVPAMDAVHYHTMLLVDRARRSGMPEEKARKNASHLGEHYCYDFEYGEFRYRGLVQHFWQPFEVRYRLRRAGFRRIRLQRHHLTWDQFAGCNELKRYPPPWDWFFQAEVPQAPLNPEVTDD